MSLAGSLEHVRLVDLIQFIYIGRRTGTLRVRGPSREASLGFQSGYISNAWVSGAPRLGELLVLAGLLPASDLQDVVAKQQSEVPPRPLGQIVIDEGLVREAEIKQLLTEQFAQLVQEMVSWTEGDFEFAVDELMPLEDLGAAAGRPIAQVQLDTQTVLLEALDELEQVRRMEEDPTILEDNPLGEFTADENAHRAGGPSGKSSHTVPNAPVVPRAPAMSPPPVARAGSTPPTSPRIQVVTRDTQLAERLAARLRHEKARVTTISSRDAGFSLPGEQPPIIVLDLRDSANGSDSLRALRRTRPRSTVVAYCLPHTSHGPIYDAGAVALVHGDEFALAACVQSVLRGRTEHATQALIREALTDGFARLRRIVSDLRSGLLGTTVLLNFMSAVADSIERALMFIIEDEQLIPIASFGLVTSAKRMASLSRTMRLSLRQPSVFSECAESDRARFGRYDDTALPSSFRAVVSQPSSKIFAVLPVSGSQHVIAMIYIDNGAKDRMLCDVHVLELAVSQLGLALENEILRRSALRRRASAQPADP
jgi:hypothetical protein